MTNISKGWDQRLEPGSPERKAGASPRGQLGRRVQIGLGIVLWLDRVRFANGIFVADSELDSPVGIEVW